MSNRKADLLSDLIKPRNPIEEAKVNTNAQTSEPSNTQTVIYINGSADERKRRYSFDLPDSLHLQLKIHAASQRKTMSDIVEEAVRQYLTQK